MIIKDCRITMIFINVDYRKSRKSCESWFRQKKSVSTLIIKDCRITMVFKNADSRKSSNQGNHVNQGPDKKNV